jgi:hypothetical protein
MPVINPEDPLVSKTYLWERKTQVTVKSFNNFQRRDVTTILIGINNSKNLLHFVMKEKNRL